MLGDVWDKSRYSVWPPFGPEIAGTLLLAKLARGKIRKQSVRGSNPHEARVVKTSNLKVPLMQCAARKAVSPNHEQLTLVLKSVFRLLAHWRRDIKIDLL